MQYIYIAIVVLGLLLAGSCGGDGIHGAEINRVWLPMVETAPVYSSIGPVIAPTATAERGPDGA